MNHGMRNIKDITWWHQTGVDRQLLQAMYVCQQLRTALHAPQYQNLPSTLASCRPRCVPPNAWCACARRSRVHEVHFYDATSKLNGIISHGFPPMPELGAAAQDAYSCPTTFWRQNDHRMLRYGAVPEELRSDAQSRDSIPGSMHSRPFPAW